MKKRNIVLGLVYIFWGIPMLLWLFFILGSLFTAQYLAYSPLEKLGSIFAGLLILPVGYILGFLLFFPHWVALIVTLIAVKKRFAKRQVYSYIVLVSNLIVLSLFIVLLYLCNLDYACYSEGPLTSGGGVLLFLFLSQIAVTLPFVYFLEKSLFQKPKVYLGAQR